VSFPVFFDTNALFGAVQKDVILELAELGIFRPLWSRDVLDELERNLARLVSPMAAAGRVAAMRDAFPDAMVSGYDALIPAMTCDPKDRHVLAAAVKADAEVLVTFNLKDFPAESLAPFDLVVVHPDDFLLDQIDLYPFHVQRALEGIATAYEAPPLTTAQLLSSLARDLPKFAARAQAELAD
jgi:predicted nucleic acid-binding protein